MKKYQISLIIIGVIIVIFILGVAKAVKMNKSNKRKEVVSELEATEIEQFNQLFTNYKGTQKGSGIKTILGVVRHSNAVHDEEHQVSIDYNGKTYSSYELDNIVKRTKSYSVSFHYDSKDRIDKIIIVEQ